MATSIARQLFEGIRDGDVAGVESLLTQNPKYLTFAGSTFPTWLHHAARYASVPMIEMLLRLGFEVNAKTQNYPDGPLIESLDFNNYDVAKALLAAGADPNQGKTLLVAISRKTPGDAQRLVKLLLEHGANIHMRHPVGSEEVQHTAWSWAQANGHHTLASYLVSQGAIEEEIAPISEEQGVPQEVPAIEEPAPEVPSEPGAITFEDPTIELFQLFEKWLGKCQLLVEDVGPGRMPILVYVSPASEDRPTHMLFTLGMSLVPMRVPEGQDAFRYAELAIELPGEWPLTSEALSKPEHGWPIEWLLTLARYPYQQKTWLGAPVTILENGNPPQPIAPGTRMSAMLLLTRAVDDIAQTDGTTVKLYKLIPLYPEECQLEKEKGLPILFAAFDQQGVHDTVNMARRSVAE